MGLLDHEQLRVVVLDTKTDRIVKIIPVEGGPVGVAFAPNGEVWFHEDGDGSVTVANSKTDEVITVIQTGGKGAGRMAVSSDGRYAASVVSIAPLIRGPSRISRLSASRFM